MPSSTQNRALPSLRQALLGTALLTAVAWPAWAQPRPTIQVNTETEGVQNAPAVAAQSTGEVFVVWEFGGARRFAADGTPVDMEEIELSQTTTVEEPDVAMNDQGSAVVVWQDDEIFARLFTFDDSEPPSNAFVVNTSLPGVQRHACVAMDAGGAFIVVYQSQSVDTSPQAIAMQRFSASGMPVGGETVVGTQDGEELDFLPHVAMDPSSGRFAVVWASSPDGFVDITVRLFDADGAPSTEPTTLGNGIDSDLAFSPDGWLLVAYSGTVGIVGDLWNPLGQRVGMDLLLVPSEESGGEVRVAALDSGEFQLAWSRGSNNGQEVFSRRIASDGTPLGDVFRVHQNLEGIQKLPDLDSIGNDVVFVFNDPDGDQSGISATCFEPGGCIEVFTDGFEAGDTTAWSTTSP